MRGLCCYLQYNHNVHNRGVLASSKWAKENKGRLAKDVAGHEGALAEPGGGSPGLRDMRWLGDHWDHWQHWHEDPWAGRYQETTERSGHWKSLVPGAGWEQQGCFVGGTGAASVEASRARMPSAAALLTAISHWASWAWNSLSCWKARRKS